MEMHSRRQGGAGGTGEVVVSILYLRCRLSALSTVSASGRTCFNSLFEMRRLRHVGPGLLGEKRVSILYLRRVKGGLCWPLARIKGFNSLFEMLVRGAGCCTSATVRVSILYLRCRGACAGQLGLDGELFQFSI